MLKRKMRKLNLSTFSLTVYQRKRRLMTTAVMSISKMKVLTTMKKDWNRILKTTDAVVKMKKNHQKKVKIYCTILKDVEKGKNLSLPVKSVIIPIILV